LEWANNQCEILYNPVDIEKIWLYLVPNDLEVMLSNLLNNAYEARYTNSKILLKVINLDRKVIIAITDYGVGISEEMINEVLNGATLKPEGHGLGLSNAVKYIKSLGGKLTLTSNKIEGTTVTITIPKPYLPKWLPNSIKITQNHEIVICDDDLSICKIWQDHFIANNIKFKYFLNSKDFIAFVNSTNKDNLLVFMDYELGESSVNGLELLKQIGIKSAYIVTNHAQHSWIQEQVADTKYYLIPKTILSKIEIQVE
jgi:hypothetical protein